jgi:SHS2 domain-containing protein
VTIPVVVPPEAKLTLQIHGNSLPQLFENTARELLKTFIDPEDVSPTLREKLVVEGADTGALLKGWVEALLNLVYNQHILFKAFRFQEFEAERTGAGKLRAEVTGELLDPLRHTFRKGPPHWRCAEVHLLNNSKTIEAQILLESGRAEQK